MLLRWVVVGVLEAESGFRRLKGYKDMSAIISRLQKTSLRPRLTRSRRPRNDQCVAHPCAAGRCHRSRGAGLPG